MPRILPQFEQSIVFLYATREQAERRDPNCGGTGFIVGRGVSGPDGKHINHTPYIVSNRHVVHEGSACVALINNSGGSSAEIVDIDQNDWIAHPDREDIAAVALGPYMTPTMQRAFICENHFVKHEEIKAFDIGGGDDVFMIGRFVGLDQGGVVTPATRMGSISIADAPLYVGQGQYQDSFAVEMRSRGGFSGSPVFVYRAETGKMPGRVSPEMLGKTPVDAPFLPGGVFDPRAIFQAGMIKLLGVNWGYITLPNEPPETNNTYMNGVVPAWKVIELLNEPKLAAAHDESTTQALGSGVKLASAGDGGKADDPAGDEILRRMLNTPPKPRRS